MAPSILAEAPEDEYVVSSEALLRVIRKRWWIVLLVVVTFTGTAVGFSLMQTPMYEASIKILIGQKQGSSVPGSLGGDIQGLEQLTLTMAEAVSTRPLAEAVIQQQNLRITPETFLKKNLRVDQIPDTQFIQVHYRDPNPERAQQVANALGEVFTRRVSEVSPGANAITATVWERAVVPNDEPVTPDPVRNGLVALVLGLIVGVGLAFLIEYRDDSWRSPEEVEEISGVATFGVIPEFKVTEGKK